MLEVETIIADHKDVILDVSFDYYGRRMATCSSDQTIKIWDEDDEDKWAVTGSWKAHSGAIWRAAWAHPEFGQIIATCSLTDRTASILEEVVEEKKSPNTPLSRRWLRRGTLQDSRKNVADLEFAPRYLGLQLATASSDGSLRIYEAPDIMNLTHWTLLHELNNKLPLSCLSWNKSTYMISQLIAVGSDEATTLTGKVFIYVYSDNARNWMKVETINEISDPVTDIAFAPNLGRSFHTFAVASKDLYVVNVRAVTDSVGNAKLDLQTIRLTDHNCPVSRVCWNMIGNMLISTGDDGCVRIWRMNYQKTWKCAAILKAKGSSAYQEPEPTFTATAAATAKYFTKGTIGSQVPWH